MLKSPFSGTQMETHRHTKDWLANLASSTNFARKICEKISLGAVYASAGTANHTDDTITLNDFAVTAYFLTEARTFIFTLRNFSGDQYRP